MIYVCDYDFSGGQRDRQVAATPEVQRPRFSARVGSVFGCVMVLVAMILAGAPDADATPAGALTELTGAGSCLTLGASRDPDCSPLAGVPGDSAQISDIGKIFDVAFSPDGRSAYVSVRENGLLGPNGFARHPGVLVVLARDPGSGRLSQLAGARGCIAQDHRPQCLHGRSLADDIKVEVSADGRFVYAASRDGVAVFSRDAATGALTQLDGTLGCLNRSGRQGCTRVPGMWLEEIRLTPDGKHLLVSVLKIPRQTDKLYRAIYVLQRDPRTGALRWPGPPAGCLSAGKPHNCIRLPAIEELPVFSADGRFAYAPAGIGDAVIAFRYDKRTGGLRQLAPEVCTQRRIKRPRAPCEAGSGGSTPLTFSPDGRYVYLADTVYDDIALFSVNRRAGTLRAVPGVFGCSRGTRSALCADEQIGEALEIRGDGRAAYQVLGDQLLVFRRDRQTGRLRVLAAPYGCLSARPKRVCTTPEKMNDYDDFTSTMSPDGRYLYLSSYATPPGPSASLIAFTTQTP